MTLVTIIGVAVALMIGFGNDFFIGIEKTSNSVSKGTVVSGTIRDSKRLPTSGENFRTYSRLGSTLGRTCVHHAVRNTVVGAYGVLAENLPDNVFVYGETGWCWGGGKFYPHRTHQNGVSVDFMTPVRRSGASVEPPGSIVDWWGYGLEFNDVGKLDDYVVDFDAIAKHLLALKAEGKKHGVKIKRIVFDPKFQKLLFKSGKAGRKVKKRFTWNKKESWVRHDEHYHVDFELSKKANHQPQASRRRVGD